MTKALTTFTRRLLLSGYYGCGHLCQIAVVLASLGSVGVAGAGLRSAGFGPYQNQKPGEASVEVRSIVAGDVVRRHMEGGESHYFELKLTADQFARILVTQEGLDIEIRVSDPSGSSYVDMDSPNGSYGLELISILARKAGVYRVQIYSYPRRPAGNYQLTLEGPRASSALDETRVTAERIFTDAQKLRGDVKVPRQQVIARYEEALVLFRDLGDLRGQGYSLSGMGRAYKSQKLLAPALQHLNEALAKLQEAGDTAGQSFVLNETGAAHRDLGDLLDAVESYSTALPLRTALGDRNGLAQLYNNLGLAYSYIGYQPLAVENYEKALIVWRELRLKAAEMNTLINLAKANAEMGDVTTALAQYQEVLRVCDVQLGQTDSPLRTDATRLKPYALNGIGLINDTWADPDAARANYDEALRLHRLIGNKRGEADTLDNLGMMHAFMGDPYEALNHFQQALVIRDDLNEPKGLGMTLSNIGYAHALLRHTEEALRELTHALEHSVASNDKRFEAYTLIRLGMAYSALKEQSKALESYERALVIQRAPKFKDRRGEAITLDKMGEALRLSSKLTEALRRHDEARELWRSVGDQQGEALSVFGMAQVEGDRLNLANASERAEEAIRIVEKLRTRVSNRQLQMMYFADKQDFYAFAIDLRIRLHELKETSSQTHLEEALALSELARARNLNDLLSEAQVVPSRNMSAQDAEKYAQLEQQIGALKQSLFNLRGFDETRSIPVVEQKLAAYDKEQDQLVRAIRRDDLDRQASRAQPLTSREIQNLLDENTLLLEYSLGEKRSYLWAVTRGGIDHFVLAARSEIERSVDQLRQALSDHEPQRSGEDTVRYLARKREAPDRYRQSALELSLLVLGQVWPQLGNRRLVIVADGGLQYIPFEALPRPDPNAAPDPLLLTNEVVYQPSASTLAILRGARQHTTTKTVAVLADPVIDSRDERVRGLAVPQNVPPNQAKERLSRSLRDIGDSGDGYLSLTKLPYSRKEADAITALAPRGTWMKAVGFKASRMTAMSPTLRQFSSVHFATHGILNDKHPELSGLVLSMVDERGLPVDGFLTLRDIYRLDLPVDLVVLSACRTGVGKKVRGEGLMGLTRGFMHAGASSVVASLWKVEDAATAELMKRFYGLMLGREKLAAATALRRAKIGMIQANNQWSAPHSWAGFTITGDWK